MKMSQLLKEFYDDWSNLDTIMVNIESRNGLVPGAWRHQAITRSIVDSLAQRSSGTYMYFYEFLLVIL